MQRKRIAVVSENPSHGLTYQRVQLPLSRLDPNEWEVRSFFIDEFMHHEGLYTDIVVINHPPSKAFFDIAHRCKFHYKIPCVVDIDDLLTNLQTDHREYRNYAGSHVTETIKLSSGLVTSTPFLAREWGHLNTKVTVIPNMVDTRRLRDLKILNKPYHSGFVVGWTGGFSHTADQYFTFLPGLMKFLDDYDDARCYFHNLCPQVLKDKYGSRVIHEHAIFDYFDYDAIKASYPIDVMLVGLYDHPFNNAKSDLKLLEMAPHDIPIIASPRAEFIRHKEKEMMLYAEDNSKDFCSWYDVLVRAYNDKELLKNIAIRAKDYVMNERDVAVATLLWKDVLNSQLELYAPLRSTKF